MNFLSFSDGTAHKGSIIEDNSLELLWIDYVKDRFNCYRIGSNPNLQAMQLLFHLLLSFLDLLSFCYADGQCIFFNYFLSLESHVTLSHHECSSQILILSKNHIDMQK